jgi:invasion protein IalB
MDAPIKSAHDSKCCVRRPAINARSGRRRARDLDLDGGRRRRYGTHARPRRRRMNEGSARMTLRGSRIGSAVAAACIWMALGTTAAAGAAQAAEPAQPPPPANEWTLDCGNDPQDGHRFCMLVYILLDPRKPGEFVNFGVARQQGLETVFLQTKAGFAKGSMVRIQVDDRQAHEFPAPVGSRPLAPPRPIDPLTVDLAKGQQAVIYFQPANGLQRNVAIPLSIFGLLLDQARQEVPPAK